MKKAVLCVLIIYMLPAVMFAQDEKSIVSHWQIEPLFGFRYLNLATFAEGEYIDFLNYPETPGDPFYYAYLGFVARVEFANNIKTEIEAAPYDHSDPAILQLNTSYFPKGNTGIIAGVTMFTYLSNEFSSFHRDKYPDYEADLHMNFQQRTRYFSAFYAGVEYFYPGEKTRFSVRLQGGFGGHHAFEEKIQQKALHANYKQVIQYNTYYRLSPVVYPEISFEQQLIDAKALTMGLSLQVSAFYSRTRIDYRRTLYTWTDINPEMEEIKSDAHNFFKMDGSLGFFLRW